MAAQAGRLAPISGKPNGVRVRVCPFAHAGVKAGDAGRETRGEPPDARNPFRNEHRAAA